MTAGLINRTMKILTTILLLFLSISSALAEEAGTPPDLKEYDVEVILFEDAHARYMSSQTWDQPQPQNDGGIIEKTGEDVDARQHDPTNFKSIKPSILKAKYKRMNASSEYKVLFYGAWRQPGLDKNKAFEIDINDLKNAHKSKSKNTLTGRFKLVLARYLHLYTDLQYHRDSVAPVTDEQQDNTGIRHDVYPLKNHRRMRSKELHYIDHPLVGMLVQINPVKQKDDKKSQ